MSDRRSFRSIAAALDEFDRWPLANRGTILEALDSMDVEAIYVPASRSYIGVFVRNQQQVVSIHSGYIWGIRDADGKVGGIALPVNRLRDGNAEPHGKIRRQRCPICDNELPTSGECDFPDQDRMHLELR